MRVRSTGRSFINSKPPRRRPFLIAVAGLALVTCSGSAEDKPKGDKLAGPVDDGGDDDLDVAAAVPMALMGGEFLAQVGDSLGPAVAGEGYKNDGSDVRDDASGGAGADEYALAKAVLNSGPRATGEMKKLLGGVQSLLDQIFGPSGYFRGKDVAFKDGATRRVFRTDAGPGQPQLIEVISNPEGSTYRFSVSLYTRAATGDLFERRTHIDLAPSADRATALVRLEHAVPNAAGASTQLITTQYDTLARTMSTTYGLSPTLPSVPAKTAIDLVLPAGQATIEVAGAYVWDRATDPVAGLAPRHYVVRTGDIEAFQMRSRFGAPNPTVQNTAFLPAESFASVGAQPGASFFQDYSYVRYVMDFLRTLVRDPDYNNGCSTSGDAFRQAFTSAGKTAPASVQSAPANLCLANAAVQDSLVNAMVDDTCRAKVDIVLNVSDGKGGTKPYSLCKRHYEAVLLANPQSSYIEGGSRVLVLAPEQPSADHVALATELAARPIQNLTPLVDRTWAPVPTKAAQDFGEAEDRP